MGADVHAGGGVDLDLADAVVVGGGVAVGSDDNVGV